MRRTDLIEVIAEVKVFAAYLIESNVNQDQNHKRTSKVDAQTRTIEVFARDDGILHIR